MRATHGQGEAGVRSGGGPNHVGVEKPWDELWVGVKCQASTEIAGSPRNSFRASLREEAYGGRALNGLRAKEVTEPYQTPNAIGGNLGVRPRVIRFVVERGTAQTSS